MAGNLHESKTRPLARWRAWIQAGFLFLWMQPAGFQLHAFCSPVFHCYSCPLATFACPIGVLANFAALQVIPLIALGTLLVAGAVFGTFVCGWACPFGFLQDLLGRIPTPKFELPRWTGACKYVVLAVGVIGLPYYVAMSGGAAESHPLFFCRLCPAGALEAAVPYSVQSAIRGDVVAWPSTAKIVILAVFFVSTLLVWRPWCGLLCPLGAIFGLFNRISLLFVRFHPDRCRECNLCERLCRYHAMRERRVSDLRCIRCLECSQCEAVTVGTAFERRRRLPQSADQ